jgi:hypothetical protein
VQLVYPGLDVTSGALKTVHLISISIPVKKSFLMWPFFAPAYACNCEACLRPCGANNGRSKDSMHKYDAQRSCPVTALFLTAAGPGGGNASEDEKTL